MSTSRQEARWGRAGQELILDSKILITGLGPAGIEALKTAAMLGVGTIYLVDNKSSEGFFLDQQLNSTEKRVKQLEKIVNNLEFQSGGTGKNVNVVAFEEDFINNSALIENLAPDAIFDFSNDPSSQSQSLEYGITLAETKPVEVFLGGCDANNMILNQYTPQEDDDLEDAEDDHILFTFEGKEQDISLSHIISSLAIESFRKELFLKNKEKLKDAKNYRGDLYEEPDSHFDSRLFYSTAAREDPDHADKTLDVRKAIAGKKFLVCGNGAIGNPVIDMLARYGAAQIDLIDYDTIEAHNIERQPFFCKRVGDYKAEVMSEKVKDIAKKTGRSIESTALVGKIGEQHPEDPADIPYYTEEWFAENRYDMIFGCFDGPIPRDNMHKYTTKLGLKYVDGGSDPIGCDVTVYVPGKTACINCTIDVETFANTARAELRALRAESCVANPEITPNVCMSNRIAAALMVIETARDLSGEYEPLDGKIEYLNVDAGIETQPWMTRCDLCKNDDTGEK